MCTKKRLLSTIVAEDSSDGHVVWGVSRLTILESEGQKIFSNRFDVIDSHSVEGDLQLAISNRSNPCWQQPTRFKVKNGQWDGRSSGRK